MKEYFARLSSLERRFVVGVLLVVFVLLNAIFVWPLFSDWTKFRARGGTAQDTLKKFETAVAQSTKYEALIHAMETEGAPAVPPEDQGNDFLRTIQSQAAQSGVGIISSSRQTPRTNQVYFIEQSQGLTVQSGEPQLVDFLYNLGAGNSLVRVRDLSLRPDAPRQGLSANIKLVATYQKKAAAPPTAAPAKTNAPAVPAAPKPSTPTKK